MAFADGVLRALMEAGGISIIDAGGITSSWSLLIEIAGPLSYEELYAVLRWLYEYSVLV